MAGFHEIKHKAQLPWANMPLITGGVLPAITSKVGDSPIRTSGSTVRNRVEDMKLSHLLCTVAAFAAGLAWTDESRGGLTGIAGSRANEAGWRRTFDVDPKNLGIVGHNPYFPLTPGLRIHLGGKDEAVVVSVLGETKVVDGVETRVVEERETEGGELVEISLNYFAIDRTTGDVYYFGEHVDDYKDGKIVGHEGAWLSGVNGAKFGLIMPGQPARGDKFYLEMAPGAEERVEIMDVDATLKTPLRTFDDLVYSLETDVLDREFSHKWYAAGIGMVGDDNLRVLKIEEPPK